MTLISPSILSANFAKLGEEIQALEKAKADMIHIDVMDGNFVQNITLGPGQIKSIRPSTAIPFDVHLMIEQPENYIQSFIDAGSDIITIHPEATKHLDRTLNQIKEYGAKSGIALLPSTSPDIIDYVIDKIDLIRVMSVNPGFGGQKFLESQLEKIKIISGKIKKHNIILSVDGGINEITAKKSIQSGANCLVAGNYVFSDKYSKQITSLKSI